MFRYFVAVVVGVVHDNVFFMLEFIDINGLP